MSAENLALRLTRLFMACRVTLAPSPLPSGKVRVGRSRHVAPTILDTVGFPRTSLDWSLVVTEFHVVAGVVREPENGPEKTGHYPSMDHATESIESA